MRAIALVLALAGAARAEAPANPHGAAEACTSCHEGAPDGPVKAEAATCRTCHPNEDHHPFDMIPATVTPATGWPLVAGAVTCATCHVEPAHQGLAGTPTPYLRGGPYGAATEFCYSCHSRGAVTRSDPHHPTAPYAVDDPSCGACHDGTPDSGASPETAHLRLGPAAVCETCHPGSPHLGTPHVGKTVPDEMRATLPPEMPVLASGAIACWTCHDVHAGHAAGNVGQSKLSQGLHALAMAESWSDLPDGAIFPGSDAEHPPMLARPLEESALCTACHGAGPP